MNNPVVLEICGTLDTGRRPTKQNLKTGYFKDEQHKTHHTLEVNTGTRDVKIVPATDKTPTMLHIHAYI